MAVGRTVNCDTKFSRRIAAKDYALNLLTPGISLVLLPVVRCGDQQLIISLIITFVGLAIATIFSPIFTADGSRVGVICMTFGIIAASMYSLSPPSPKKALRKGMYTSASL